MERGVWWATVHGVIESGMTEQLTLYIRKHKVQVWLYFPIDWESLKCLFYCQNSTQPCAFPCNYKYGKLAQVNHEFF